MQMQEITVRTASYRKAKALERENKVLLRFLVVVSLVLVFQSLLFCWQARQMANTYKALSASAEMRAAVANQETQVYKALLSYVVEE